MGSWGGKVEFWGKQCRWLSIVSRGYKVFIIRGAGCSHVECRLLLDRANHGGQLQTTRLSAVTSHT